uniref:S-adenosyl-L-homocysteine hydrolase NAD binding domain-containing protein n=1 Tax=Alexandrium monilatum TaxID=311494 RepID=A0A7S4RTR8_9DINO
MAQAISSQGTAADRKADTQRHGADLSTSLNCSTFRSFCSFLLLHTVQSIYAPQVCIECFQVGPMESVVGEIVFLPSTTGNNDISLIEHMRKMKNSAMVENIGPLCSSSLSVQSVRTLQVCIEDFQVVTMESVAGEIDLIPFVTGSKDKFFQAT